MEENIWKIEDPDRVLSRAADEVLSIELNGFICKEIIPREDLIQAKNIKGGHILDLGYYGADGLNNGVWVINIVGSNCDWESPIEKTECSSLVESINILKNKLKKYA